MLAAENHSMSCRLAAGLLLLLAGVPAGLWAEADGPDHYRVTGVVADDLLNIRAEPNPRAEKVGEIPSDGNCIRNLGCRGGLTMDEYSTLSAEQKTRRLRENPRWCKIDYQGVEGWVAGRYLAEGGCD